MSDYIARLDESLRDAAARRYPPAAQVRSTGVPVVPAPPARPARWPRRWRSSVAALAVLVLAGGSTAAAIAVLDHGSAPLTGSVPGTRAPLRYDVPLTPDLEAGDAGWCSYPTFAITGSIDSAGAGTCSPAVPPGAPVLLGGAEPLSNEQALLRHAGQRLGRQLNLFWMVVSSRVAAVLIDPHEVIASRPDARLPSGWRAVVAFTSVPLDRLRPVPLDRYGHIIAAQRKTGVHLVQGSGVSTVRTYVPGSSAPAPCAIRPVRLAGVTAQWEVVATATPSLGSAVLPGTLFSCARSWFSIKGQKEAPSAAVLLNAQSPRRLAPAPPGLTPTGLPGIFSNASAGIVAKRVGAGWLVVQSNSSATGRRLLNAIRIAGPAVRP